MGPIWVVSAPCWPHEPWYQEFDVIFVFGIRSPPACFCRSDTCLELMIWSTYNHHKCFALTGWVIGIDTKIEVIVVSPTTWEAHHSPRAKPEGCGELPRSLVTPQWPKSRYQFRFYHDAPKHIKFMQIRVCISRKSLIKLLQISHHGKHGHRPLSQQLP